MTMSEEIPTVVAQQVLLGNHLKALKLPTFAREYASMRRLQSALWTRRHAGHRQPAIR